MAYHPERHTMDVRLSDGRIVERQIESITVGPGLRELNPVLRPGEEVIRAIGDDTPMIVETHMPPPDDPDDQGPRFW